MPVGATPAAVAAASDRPPPPRAARRLRPRSRPPSPPAVDNSGAGFVRRNLGRKLSRGAAVSLSAPAAPGMSVPLFLSMLAVSAGAVPPPAAAAAAAAVAALSSATAASSSPRFPLFSAAATTAAGTGAFCFPASWTTHSVFPPAREKRPGGALRPSPSRRLRSRRSSRAALSAAAAAAPGRSSSSPSSLGCRLLQVGSTAPPSCSLRGNSRLGGGSPPRWSWGGGSHAGRALAPLSRVCGMVGLGHTDDWGGGSTEETNYRSEGHDGAGAAAEWDDVGFLSGFEFSGDGSDAHGGAHGGDSITTWGDGASEGARAPSLSKRDAARLEEVGIMVRELEDGAGDNAASVAARGARAGEAGAGTATAARQPSRPSRERGDGGGGHANEGNPAPERKGDVVGGVAVGNARLRMTYGDPVFFGQLAELMQGVHRHSGGRKFLTHAEEMSLGVKVQRYRRLIEAQEKAEKENGRRPPLREVARSSAGLSEDEFAAVMQEGMEARQKLVVCNLALVVSLSNKYKRRHFHCNCLQTLIQEGTIGLIRAAERYDPDKGFRFTTYAIWWIEARLRVSVQTEERMIHVPMWVKNKYNIVSRSIPNLREALGREPTCEEIAKQVAIDTDSKVVLTPKRVKELQTWVAFHREHESLDMPLEVGARLPLDCSTIEHGVKAPEPSLETTSELEIQRDFLESCLVQDLSRIQRKILRMKVGLGGEKGKNRQEISRALKMPFNNVISEERKAFYKLRGLQRGGGYPSFEELK
eukprot:g4376.t1